MIVPPHVLAAIRQPAIVYRPEGIVEAANDRAEALAGGPLAGTTPAELVARLSIRHRDGTPLLARELPAARALRGEEAVDVPLDVTAAGGRTVHVLATASPVRDGDTVAGALSVWQDVTARVGAEEALRESEELYRRLFENTEDGFALVEPIVDGTGRSDDYRVLKVNAAWEGQTGFRGADFVGRRIREAMPGVEPPWTDDFAEVARSGLNRHFESYNAISGQWFDLHAFPYREGQVGVLVREITDRKRAEASLRESEGRYRAVIETAGEGFTIAGPDGSYTFVNWRMAEMLGYPVEEILGKSSEDFAADPRVPMVFRHRAGVHDGAADEGEFRFRRKDGSDLWTRYTATPLFDEQGEQTATFVFYSDITERKAAEEALAAERQRFLDVLETLPAMICLLTPDHHVAFANRAFRERFGESNGRPCHELCFGSAGPCPFCEAFVPLETGWPHHWEFTFPDGSAVIDAYDFPFTDLDGSPLVLEMGIDITVQKRAEEARREDERRHAFLLALGDHVRELDDSAAIEAAASEMLGRHLGATGVAYCEVDDGGVCATVRAGWTDGTVPAATGSFCLDDLGVGDLLRRGQVRESGGAAPNGRAAGIYRELGIRALVAAPVCRGGRLGAVLAVHSATPREWTDAEVELVRHVGDRIWAAVQRARAEEALRESEADARSFMANMIDAVAICEPVLDAAGEPVDLRVVEVNPAFLDDLPLAEDEVVGRTVSAILPDMDRSWLDRPLDAARSRSPVAFEEPFPALGRWYRAAVFPVRGGRVAVVLDDVTEQRDAEEALLERDLRLNLALDVAAVGVFDWNPLTGEETWDDRIRQQWGLSPGAPVDHAVFEARIHPDDRAAVAAANRAALDPAGDGRYAARYRVIGPGDGVERRIESRGQAFFEAGRAVRMIGTTIDVSERERAEEAVRARERLVQSIYHAAPVGIGLISGLDPGRRFEQVNDHLLEMTGYSRGELLGQETRILYPDDAAHASVGEESASLLEAFGRGEVETRWRREDGTVIDVLLSSSLIDPANPASDVIFAALDITELRETEKALMRYARDLRHSNEELQRFAYVASHDLQEPLRSIISFSQLLERRYRGKLDPDADEFIGFIVEGGIRMQRLIADLLQVSRIETHAREPAPTDAGAVVDAATRSLDEAIREAGATVTVGPLPTVMADAAQLEQVFVNLVSNAIKYRSPDRPPAIAISAERTDGMVEFAVKDNGIGIEAEYFDRIFEMFRRLHTHDQYEGTGIGLAVVKRIVERHGGTVGIASTPGEGSTFFFTLPAARADRKANP